MNQSGIVQIGSKIDIHMGGFFSRNRVKKQLQAAIDSVDRETYLCKRFEDGAERLERITSVQKNGAIGKDDICVQVTTQGFVSELAYARLTDKEGTDFDLVIVGQWKISNRRAFLQGYGLSRFRTSAAIEVTCLETLLTKRCRSAIQDEMRTVSYGLLKGRDALPSHWWTKKLPHWINIDWLELVEILEVRYESVMAERVAETERRRELLELEDAERDEQVKREFAQQQEEAEYEQAMRDLQLAQDIKEQDRMHQIEQLTFKHEQQILQQQREAELAAINHETQKTKLLTEIEELRNREEAAKDILQRAKETEQSIEMKLQAIEAAQKQQAKAALLSAQVSQHGVYALGRLKTAVAGISTASQELLGKSQGPAFLAQVFREKAIAEPDAVMMRKIEMRTRDIGTKKVDLLPINSPLGFEILATRRGYATVLNVGTSGKVWLQAPNAYVGIEQSRVAPSTRYQVPGPILLPEESLRQNGLAYVEIGPPGWEELIVVLSEAPLVTEADLFRSTPNSPFVELEPERIEQLLDQLSEMPEETWAAGVLSFLVE